MNETLKISVNILAPDPMTPDAQMLDELEASKQSRVRAWNALQKLRSVLSEGGNAAIPPLPQKTFDAGGEALEHALTKSFRLRNDGSKVCAPRSADFGMRPSRKNAEAIIRTLFRLLWKALDRDCLPVSYPDSTTTGSADQLEHCADTGCPRDPVQPGETLRRLVRESERCAVF